MLVNKYTGERLEVVKTPSGSHIVKKPNGFEEWHRGTLASSRAYLENLATAMPYIWEWEIIVRDTE